MPNETAIRWPTSEALLRNVLARSEPCGRHSRAARTLGVWSRGLMEHSSHRNGGMRYGPGSSRERPQTAAVRRAIQHSQESLRVLARRHGINPKTVSKWKKRKSAADLPTGPKAPRSTVLALEEEAVIVAFRRHTLLPLDDCLYALQATIPHLTRSSLHRCLQRHDMSRLPETEGDTPAKKRFKPYPIGYFHIDIAEVRTEQGKLHLFVAIDRTSKF